jgi:tetratricopeptide (TPR) repeat protein
MLSHDTLNDLANAGKWGQIILMTDNMSSNEVRVPGFFFFRGIAFLSQGRATEAIPSIQNGLMLDPNSSWGNRLLFDAYCKSNKIPQAFESFASFIDSNEANEGERAWFVQTAVEMGEFDVACAMNETRTVIRNVSKSPKYALALQCFCKADTLERVFESLMALTNCDNFALVILQDSVVNSPKADRYAAGAAAVQKSLEAWHPKLLRKFYSVEYLQNPVNLGTAPSCRRLLDHVCAKYEGFLFIEDDCILAPSALAWTEYHIRHNLALDSRWFTSCESIFFDREERVLTAEAKDRLQTLAATAQLRNAYILVDLVPSTCFATTAEIWGHAAQLRSCTRGPETLNHYVKSKSIQTIMPVVPHAEDIGMLHELGYSVANMGFENVRERKGTYLLAQGEFDETLCRVYDGSKDILYGATSKLYNHSIAVLEKELLATVRRGVGTSDQKSDGKSP